MCDTDYIALTVDDKPLRDGQLLPFASSVSDRKWGHFGRHHFYTKSHLLDMPCAVGQSLLLPLAGQLPLVRPLVQEIRERNALLAGGSDVQQLSFSCMEAWVAAAAAAMNVNVSLLRTVL